MHFYDICKAVIYFSFLVQYSWWQSWCTASTLQGPARRLLCYGMCSIALAFSFCSHCFGVYLWRVLEMLFDRNNVCRLWICWGQAYGMSGIITLMRMSI